MITGNKSAAGIAHLMRRAGFGLSIDELEIYLDLDYESIVDQLVEPKSVTDVEDDILERYYVGEHFNIKVGEWFYRMLNSRRQLQEKMVLFWHQVFATGISKNEHIFFLRIHQNQLQALKLYRVHLISLPARQN